MLTLKQIKSTINLIRKAGETMDERIHSVGVSIAHHAEQHGDWTEFQRLYDVMPKSSRRKALVTWIIDHTPLKFDDKAGLFVKAKTNKKPYDFEAMNQTPFWEYTKEVVQSLDVDKLLDLNTLIAAAEKRLDNATEKGAEIKGDLKAFHARLVHFKDMSHTLNTVN